MRLKHMTLGLSLATLAFAHTATYADCGSHSKTRKASAKGSNIVQTAIAAGSFKTLAAALEAADLVDALQDTGPFTVFAPTDDAFANLPKGTLESLLDPANKAQLAGILTYHVVPGRVPAGSVVDLSSADTLNGQRLDIAFDGESVMVDQATVIKTDIACNNGIIHVIDKVMLPSANNIPATAESAGMFSTLLAAVNAGGLGDALSSDGPFTVFAPTDEAFAKLPEGTIQSLLEPQNRETLQAVLKYHVVSGRVYADQAIAAREAETLQGQEVAIRFKGGRLRINDAAVVSGDIDASNGVIHVIDNVLMPVLEQADAAPKSARELLMLAIERGVPQFNHGNTQACADIYEVALEGLLSNASISADGRARLSRALSEARATRDSTAKAWALRRGMDDVLTNDIMMVADNRH